MPEAALTVDDLTVLAAHAGGEVALIDEVGLVVRRGEVLGVLGESGAGKTTLMRACLGLLGGGVRARGSLVLAGGDAIDLASPDALRTVRGRRIGAVFQNPVGMFDPLFRVEDQLLEGLGRDRAAAAAARERCRRLLVELGFGEPDGVLRAYPHQLSGGMAQRVAVAMALVREPAVLVADEPTSALDANLRIDMLRLLRRMASAGDVGVLLISHDLRLVARFCDRVAIMYAGRVVETGPTTDVLGAPAHPYTAALLACSPGPDAAPRQPLPQIHGVQPRPGQRPDGCEFADRCPDVIALCREERPGPVTRGDRAATCHLAFRSEPVS